MVLSKYFLPTKIIFGEKTYAQLFTGLEAAGVKKPLVMCGEHFLSSFKYKLLEERLPFFELCTSIGPNPSIAAVDSAARMLNEKDCDAVIGIGGGSVLDAAKVVACMKGSKKSCLSFYKKISVKKSVPFFAVPTTSGSGSEVTKYSVLTLPDGSKKSLQDNRFYAKVAIVDPEMTYSMPPEVTAATGIDAFCQAIEAYWSRKATPETDKFAEESIPLSFHSLFKAVKEPDKAVRQNMSLASLRAGQAFSQTGTTACHTLSYAFTKHYGLVHGFAVAITLPWFLAFYSEKKMDKCLSLCSLLGAKTIEDGRARVKELMRGIGCPTTLREIGARREDFDKIIAMSMDQKPQNPRKHSKEELERLLNAIY